MDSPLRTLAVVTAAAAAVLAPVARAEDLCTVTVVVANQVSQPVTVPCPPPPAPWLLPATVKIPPSGPIGP